MRKALYVMVAVAVLGMLAAYEYGIEARQAAVSSPVASASMSASASPGTSGTPVVAASASVAPSSPASSTPTSIYKDGTYSGGTVNNRFESVQVKITVTGGKITVADAVVSVNESRSQQFVDFALPDLKAATLKAQSATIDGVSGATYISDSYIQSLQSAVDKARS